MKTPEEFYREVYPNITELSIMDKEIILLMSVYKKRIEENNFVHIVEDRKGNYVSFHRLREDAEKEIKRVQRNHREALVINCQKIY